MSVFVDNLGIELAGSGKPIVKGVSFEIKPGKVLGIVGESGSGKTTVALAMLGYARNGTCISKGSRVEIDGKDILSQTATEIRSMRGKLVSYVPQDPNASLNPALTLREQLVEGLVTGRNKMNRAEALERVSSLLAEVGLPSTREFLERYPTQVSGGQLQRIAIAMAIAAHPRLIVLDEPTTGLDVSVQNDVLRMVSRLCTQYQISAIYVSHDLAVVSHVAHHVLVLYTGRVVEYAECRDLFARPSHPYTRALLQAIPSIRERRELRSIPGTVEANRMTGGCVFRARCLFARAKCEIEPDLSESGPADHLVRCHWPIQGPLERLLSVIEREDAAAAQPLLQIVGLNASYGRHAVLHDVNLDLHPGRCFAVVGESGSGKSTLSRSIVGLHSQWDGKIELQGRRLEPNCRRRDRGSQQSIQYVFQNPYGSLNPRRTIGDSIVSVYSHFFGVHGNNAQRRVKETLGRVGIPSSYFDRFPNELSGGEKQRCAIARALICSPQIVVCDEITSALDVSVQATIIELLRGLMRDGLSLIFVTHDLGVVRSIADDVAVMNAGRLVELGNSDQVMLAPRADYTRHLLANSLELVDA
ncbi:ABC transporter ATP-binding protein [Mesorhizobium argentiipisi]|uniref:ABC transporter ATP-binding protein n=1 Tax=Mesorhizobium argentiipisi TaxID=3015175 RepID=A0ABU8KL21_9HYPH